MKAVLMPKSLAHKQRQSASDELYKGSLSSNVIFVSPLRGLAISELLMQA